MNIAYCRVSTIEQHEDRQLAAMQNRSIDKYFIEKASGKSMDRPELKAMLEYAREGDTIYVHDLSRLARSTSDLLKIVELLQKKNISLISNKESIDTNTATGKLMLTMIAAINEFERSNLKERQLEGTQIARLAGKYTGRKRIPKPKNWDEVIEKYFRRQITAKEAQQQLQLKPNTFYNFINANKSVASNSTDLIIYNENNQTN